MPWVIWCSPCFPLHFLSADSADMLFTPGLQAGAKQEATLQGEQPLEKYFQTQVQQLKYQYFIIVILWLQPKYCTVPVTRKKIVSAQTRTTFAFEMNMYTEIALLYSVCVKGHKNFIFLPVTVKMEPWRLRLHGKIRVRLSKYVNSVSKFWRFVVAGKETEMCVDHCYKV